MEVVTPCFIITKSWMWPFVSLNGDISMCTTHICVPRGLLVSLRGVCTWCLPTELWLPSDTQDHTLLSQSLHTIGIHCALVEAIVVLVVMALRTRCRWRWRWWVIDIITTKQQKLWSEIFAKRLVLMRARSLTVWAHSNSRMIKD